MEGSNSCNWIIFYTVRASLLCEFSGSSDWWGSHFLSGVFFLLHQNFHISETSVLVLHLENSGSPFLTHFLSIYVAFSILYPSHDVCSQNSWLRLFIHIIFLFFFFFFLFFFLKKIYFKNYASYFNVMYKAFKTYFTMIYVDGYFLNVTSAVW